MKLGFARSGVFRNGHERVCRLSDRGAAAGGRRRCSRSAARRFEREPGRCAAGRGHGPVRRRRQIGSPTPRRYAPYARWIPQVGAARRARSRDATGRAALLEEGLRRRCCRARPIRSAPSTAANVDLQLVVANASFRNAPARRSRTRPCQLQALDEAIGSYMAVLKNDNWHADAAFNYEYLLRLRDELAQGKRKPGAIAGEERQPGRAGDRRRRTAAPRSSRSTSRSRAANAPKSRRSRQGRPIQKKG